MPVSVTACRNRRVCRSPGSSRGWHLAGDMRCFLAGCCTTATTGGRSRPSWWWRMAAVVGTPLDGTSRSPSLGKILLTIRPTPSSDHPDHDVFDPPARNRVIWYRSSIAIDPLCFAVLWFRSTSAPPGWKGCARERHQPLLSDRLPGSRSIDTHTHGAHESPPHLFRCFEPAGAGRHARGLRPNDRWAGRAGHRQCGLSGCRSPAPGSGRQHARLCRGTAAGRFRGRYRREPHQTIDAKRHRPVLRQDQARGVGRIFFQRVWNSVGPTDLYDPDQCADLDRSRPAA